MLDYRSIEEKTTHRPEETEAFAARFSELVENGDAVALIGPLGAGKTTFVRGFIHALGYDGPVRSPSFSLANRYSSHPPVTHLDLYRITDSSELIALDIAGESDNRILLIEWGDRFDDFFNLPVWRIQLDFSTSGQNETERIIRLDRLKD